MPQRPTASGARTRQRILDAAEQLMRTAGVARATTKEIARAAGISEAALYRHFSGKEEMFVKVLEERLPGLGTLIGNLAQDPGERTTEECLAEIARTATLFYEASTPIAASLFAEPALLERHREGLRKLGAGPHRPLDALAGYLRSLRDAGRVRRDADPDAAAALLLGACYQRAQLTLFAREEEPPASLDDFATSLARTLLDGIR
ncbi:TetR family transcriptional regulator [Sphaerisporangium siamense]|uniref:AcrR family transcriptional regulator n=1 Tax=Sphaerisporangium siamense TaxID=795645 RepID=A0A7W7G7H9_9ACTN|nr:TetR/AcrR family transcriptional regulator [Sphaerisporangium siamense]MBB4699157.1 AcrR family transcriptional regulator [Sphaerisporangium siamense]GII86716.1 TetR family transcriptional regulator [Sphaerisporangium siamense]